MLAELEVLTSSFLSSSRTGTIVLAELGVMTSSFSLMGVAVFAVILALTLASLSGVGVQTLPSPSGVGVQTLADMVLSNSSSRIGLIARADMAKLTAVMVAVC